MASARVPMSHMVSIRKRFLRSVHLERDFYAKDASDSYVMTSGASMVLSSLARGHSDPTYRAQCISGPYGSGKSALALYFARLLDGATASGRDHVSDEIISGRRLLFQSAELGYLPVLVTGTRESLAGPLTLGLERSLQKAGMQGLYKELPGNRGRRADSTRAIVQMYEELARLVVEKGHASGVLVVVDELGKLLEYAASHPADSDLHLLQEMAEAASRSREFPLWFVTILHQQFSQYAVRLGRRHQREWTKVQQRFFDVPCVLDDLDALQLVAAALNASDRVEIRGNRHIRETATASSQFAPRGRQTGFEELCTSSYPLHPTTLICLPSLFRRFGQNERSLFSFLAANEQFSLFEWVQGHSFEPRNPPFFRLPDLYDYARHTLIGGAPNPQVARSWTEVDDALSRLGDASQDQIDCLKTIGLLSLLGETPRLPASRKVLELALFPPRGSEKRTNAVIQHLMERRLVVFRRFRDAYRLWEGSDIDVSERLAAARQALPSHPITKGVARDLCPAAPLIARRHAFQKGMLRSFSVTPSSSDDFSAVVGANTDRDGLIIQCLVEDDEQWASVMKTAQGLRDPSRIVMLGKETDELVEAARDVFTLEWVKQNTPALAGDRVARREVSERRLEAETAFRAEWNRIFQPGSSDVRVYRQGDQCRVNTVRDFTRLLSDACDETFPYAPVLKNELINRRHLSSATAAARQTLIEAMISSGAEPILAIKGYPPARSIYESLLLQSGIHRSVSDGKWALCRPDDKDPGLQKAWDHVVQAGRSEQFDRKPVSELFCELTSPPYGVADGFVPVLFCACLIANSSTMALYEENIFVHEPSGPTMERLMKAPHKFSVVCYDLSGERAAAIDRFARGYGVERGVLPIVRSLYARMGSLPAYTRATRNLSAETAAVRDTIERAKSPERLLFNDLAIAAGCKPLALSGKPEQDAKNFEKFFDALNKAFDALIRCYPNLLERVRLGIVSIFDVRGGEVSWRGLVAERAEKLQGVILDSALRALMVHARDPSPGEKEYLESLGTAIVGQPPVLWNDEDEDKFTRLVPQLASKLRATESIQQLDSSLGSEEEGYLVTIHGRRGQEARRIVRYSKAEKESVRKLAQTLSNRMMRGVDRRILLAALAQAANQLIQSETEDESREEPTKGG